MVKRAAPVGVIVTYTGEGFKKATQPIVAQVFLGCLNTGIIQGHFFQAGIHHLLQILIAKALPSTP